MVFVMCNVFKNVYAVTIRLQFGPDADATEYLSCLSDVAQSPLFMNGTTATALRKLGWPRRKSLQKLKDTLRSKTKRTNGDSLKCGIAQVNQTLRGWFGYFKHSNYYNVFQDIDQWLRGRLRSILRKRRGGRGRGRGGDQQRWRNRYFAALGLFSLVTAHKSASQSSRR